ncbi:DUF932 domain-containing protein, partial [Massilia sp. CCM 8694]|nr:DUF932 domain-containing protein [Massilia genomosp. 1]
MTLFDGHGRGAELASAKGTAFGLLNAVTEFVDHERRARSNDHRLESAWFGQGAACNRSRPGRNRRQRGCGDALSGGGDHSGDVDPGGNGPLAASLD